MTILTVTILLAMTWMFALAYYIRTLMLPSPAAKR